MCGNVYAFFVMVDVICNRQFFVVYETMSDVFLVEKINWFQKEINT